MNCSSDQGCRAPQSTSSTDVSIDDLFSQPGIAPLISNEVKSKLEVYINVIALSMTSLFGMAANALNVTVFWRQGLKESITLGFFALSISDFVLVLMSQVTACCYAAKVILVDSNIDFPSVHYVSSGTVRNMGYSISNVLTAFLSLERCCCVVLPFKVKFIFTRSRTAVAIAVIVAVHFICYAPFFATQELRWIASSPQSGQSGNDSLVTYKLRVHFSPQRPAIEKFNYILLSIITPTLSQVVVTVCAVVMINGLKESSKFRTGATTSDTSTVVQTTSGGRNIPVARNATKQLPDKDASGDNNNDKLTVRDARLVRTMVFLVVILSISNIPMLAILYAQILIPYLNIGRPYHNTFTLSHIIVYVLSCINASANVFVYYKNSTRYREILRSLLCTKNLHE